MNEPSGVCCWVLISPVPPHLGQAFLDVPGLAPHADTNAVVVSLGEKYDTEGADVSEEIAALKAIKSQQEGYLKEVYAEELAGIQKATRLMNKIVTGE